LEHLIQAAKTKETSSNEIVSQEIINKYYKDGSYKLYINYPYYNKPFLASMANVAASRIRNTDKILVGIKFLILDKSLNKEIAVFTKSDVFFLQKDFVISRISGKDKAVNQNIGIDSSTDNFSRLARLFNQKDYIYLSEPIYNYEKNPIGAIILAKSQNDINILKRQNIFLILALIIAVASVISIIAYIISRRIMDSLEQITGVTRAVRLGDFTKRINVKPSDNLAQITISINKMIDSLEDREKRIAEYQAKIQEQKEYFRALFNSMADGILTISDKCIITNLNPSISIWSGIEEKDIIGRNLSDILKCKCRIDCSNKNLNIGGMCPLLSQNERLAPTEAIITNKITKQDKLLSINVSLVSGVEGEPIYIMVLRDITESKELEKMREDFIAALTHDLRVPILAEANTLKFFLKGTFGSYNNKQKEALENMLECNSDLLKLVNSLLDAFKFEAGEEEITMQLTNIKNLAQDCINELFPIAMKNSHLLENKITSEIPLLMIDRDEIKRVIVNLVSNSITYTPKGGSITIDAEHGSNEVIIKVIDTGKGIPEDEINLVFDRFFSQAKKFSKLGTGLGLYLSKKIIEKHNGRIWVESNLGKGSTFSFSIPYDSK